MNNKYTICKKEINKEIPVCTQNIEEVELFKTIAQNDIYKIYENGKDVTKKYKRM